jgi:hypothetical protein
MKTEAPREATPRKSPIRHYLNELKGRQTGRDHMQGNAYSYAEVPDWALRQAVDAHDALVEALREIAAGAVPDYGSDPDYRTRGEMGNIASVALAFLTDEEQADG